MLGQEDQSISWCSLPTFDAYAAEIQHQQHGTVHPASPNEFPLVFSVSAFSKESPDVFECLWQA